MKVSEAIECYAFAVLELEEGTQKWYAECLQRFSDWCDSRGLELENVKQIETRKYIDYLRTTPGVGYYHLTRYTDMLAP